jgi:hypothetical protein
MRPHQPAPPQEEAQVNDSLLSASGEEIGVGATNYDDYACDGHEGDKVTTLFPPHMAFIFGRACLLLFFSRVRDCVKEDYPTCSVNR